MADRTESNVDDIVGNVKRFRILCVGRSGAGKSALINHVFRIKSAAVSQYEVGRAEIEQEFTSDENEFLVLHDSEGFEPGDTKTFAVVSNFLSNRRDPSLPLKDQLHAMWLCTETPRAGGRVFETGDEKLLQLARDKDIPLVLVFTKYDRLVKTKRAELREDAEDRGETVNPKQLTEQSKKEAEIALNTFVNSKTVKDAMAGLHYAQVSTQSGYDADVSKLVDLTGSVVRQRLEGNNAWIMWAIAQRAALQLKIDAWLTACTADYGRALASGVDGSQPQLLGDLLAKVHNDIITLWKFIDQQDILRSEAFGNLMFLLVQDAEESRTQRLSGAYPVPSSSKAIQQIYRDLGPITDAQSNKVPTFASTNFLRQLRSEALVKEARAQRLLITYAADLTAVLESLFDVRLGSKEPEKTTWLELKKAFESYERPPPESRKRSRQQIHDYIHTTFPDQKKLDEKRFYNVFEGLVKGARPRRRPAPEKKQDAGPPSRTNVVPRHSADVAAKAKDLSTQLRHASRMGHVDDARRLLDDGADDKVRDEDGRTPLHHASSSGHVEVVRLFLERRTDAAPRDKVGSTPLHMAAREGHVQVARALLGRDGTDTKTPDNNPNVCPRDERSMTPLHLASMFGHLEVVQLLLDIDKNPDVENEDQQTPLFLASSAGRVEVAQLLLSREADSSHPDWMKRSPLHIASENGHFDVAELLIEKGADVNVKDAHLWTPLHVASKTGKLRVAEVLLRLGADVGAQNDFRRTPLHMASQEGHLELVQLLLDHRAGVEILDGNDETALHLAAYYGHLEVTTFLLNRGAKREVKTKNLKMPSDLAFDKGHLRVAQLLTVGVTAWE